MDRSERLNHPDVQPLIETYKPSDNALTTLQKRYLLRNADGSFAETSIELFDRVAWDISRGDIEHGESEEIAFESYKTFLGMMLRGEFLPNTPTLFNAGTPCQMLSACYVLDIEDSIESIYETLKQTAHVHRSGGGTGFSFSKLREEGSFVHTTAGTASGPIDFLKLYDASTNAIKQGGKR